jgi:hypothetical protein
VWIDSNFGWLTSEDHEALLKRAVEQFHLDSYVPHRRTPKTFLAVTRLLGLQVVRPPVPVEFAIGAWTAAGSDIYIPPSSLTFTAPFFRTEPGQLHLVPIAKWLKQHRLASHPGVDHAQITLAESHAGTIEEAMTSTEEWVVDTLD